MSVVTTTQLSFIELNPILVLLTSVIDEKNKTKTYSEIYSLCWTYYVFHIQLMLVGLNTAVEIWSLCIQTLDFQSIYLCVNHLPWCSAWDRFSGCFKSDECSDDGKYTPHINKTMPPKLETEANRNQPHPQQCSSLQIRKDVLVTEVNQCILHQNHIS